MGSIVLTTGLALAGAPAASAAPRPAAWAQGQFLSGNVLGINLNDIVEIKPAEVSNNGSQEMQWQDDPLQVEVLNTIPINLPNGLQLSLGSVLDSGVVGQYAQAAKDGASMAATGAVGDDGGIGIGTAARGAAGDLELQLNSLVQSAFANVLTDLQLNVDGISSQAIASGDVASGAYTISDATLSFTSPAVANLTEKVAAALDGVDQQLISIGSDDGELGNAIDKILDPVLGAVGSSAVVTVDIDSDLQGAVKNLLQSKYGNGAVSFDLETGKVYVDLQTLLGGDINALAPNTEILSGPVVNKVLNGITDTVATLADDIVDKVRDVLNNAKVTVSAKLDLLSPQDGGSTTECRIVDLPVVGDILDGVLGGDLGSVGDLLDLPGVNQLSDLTGILSTTQLNELTSALGVSDLTQLDGLTNLSQLTNVLSGSGGGLGGSLGGLFGRTLPKPELAKPTLCEVVRNVLPDLRSTVDLTIVGNVDDLINGTATTANLTVSLLDGTIPVSLNAAAFLPSLGDGLEEGLFGDDGSVQALVDGLNTGLVNPAVDGLLGDGNSVTTVLNDIISVKANVQELTPVAGGTMFSQTAVQLSLFPGADSSADSGESQVNFARSSVGPNAAVVVPPECTDGNCTPCTTNCTPTPPCTGVCTSGPAGLAYTGVGIATLIAIILALLAAGAYLAREGYRRNHTKSLTSD